MGGQPLPALRSDQPLQRGQFVAGESGGDGSGASGGSGTNPARVPPVGSAM